MLSFPGQIGFLVVSKMRWEKVEVNPNPNPIGTEGEGGGGGGVGGEVSGPGKRWGHTCNAINGGRLVYVFGGYGKDNCQTNQVHVFDTGDSLHPSLSFYYSSSSLSQSSVFFFNYSVLSLCHLGLFGIAVCFIF